MDIIKLNFNVILKHILDMDPKPLSRVTKNDQEPILINQQQQQQQPQQDLLNGTTHIEAQSSVGLKTQFNKYNPSETSWFNLNKKISSRKDGISKKASKSDFDPIRSKTSRLDLTGPPLNDGLRLKYLLCIFGLFNWYNVPFFLAFFYKIIIHSITYIVIFRWTEKFWSLNLIDESFRNPIFLFIGFLGIISTTIQILYNVYLTTFCLYPIEKILTFPRLCFIRKDVLEMIGSRTIRSYIFGSIYHAILLEMLCKRDFDDFLNEFNFGEFILTVIAVADYNLCIVGVGLIDFYVRTSFGHWLLALKDHLEKQFKYLHSQNNRSDRNNYNNNNNINDNAIGNSNNNNNENITTDNMELVSFTITPQADIATQNVSQSEICDNIRIITLDEIQKSLNNMDDQLEIMRSVHSFSLVVASLNAFLTNGALILLTYHLLSDEHKYYHGFILFLISLNYWAAVFSCYFGDSWLYYGLSSLVETIEDEYFVQMDIKQTTSNQIKTFPTQDALTDKSNLSKSLDINSNAHENDIESYDEINTNKNNDHIFVSSLIKFADSDTTNDNQVVSPILRKKHVLFFSEFLHQFENHLATPWTNLTFESHLHILRAFVTLIAAQIIFDHEH